MRRALAIGAAAAMMFAASCARAGEGGKLYSIETRPSPGPVQAGEQGSVGIRIKPGEGAYVSEEAPLKITLSARNLKLEKDRLGRADGRYEQGGPSFEIPFTAEASGEGAVQADLVFYMCKKDLCEREVEKLTIPVTVK